MSSAGTFVWVVRHWMGSWICVGSGDSMISAGMFVVIVMMMMMMVTMISTVQVTNTASQMFAGLRQSKVEFSTYLPACSGSAATVERSPPAASV